MSRETQKLQVCNQLAVFDQTWKAAAELGIDILPMLREHADFVDGGGFKITVENILLPIYWQLQERLALRESE